MQPGTDRGAIANDDNRMSAMRHASCTASCAESRSRSIRIADAYSEGR